MKADAVQRNAGPNAVPAVMHTPRPRFFEWRDCWTLEVGFMDDDHRLLADVLNRIARDFGDWSGPPGLPGVATGRSASDLLGALDDLGQHVRGHFQREEDVMRTLDYRDYPAHKSEHDILLAEYAVMVRGIRASGRETLDISTLETLKDWLMGHVLEVDRQLAEFLKNPPEPETRTTPDE